MDGNPEQQVDIGDVGTFVYRPLGDASTHIRLLRLEPRSHHSPSLRTLKYRLEVHRLDNAPDFAALSYQWGDEENAKYRIHIHGRQLDVRKNLSDFLDQFWRTNSCLGGTEGYIWIDAICINQLDVQERGLQIMLMRPIYSRAICTLLWLGADAAQDLAAVQRMQEAYDLGNMPSPNINWKTLELDAEYESAYRILQNAYWTRTWIMQEIIFSQRIELCAGSCSLVNWHSYARCLGFYASILDRKLEEARVGGNWSHDLRDKRVSIHRGTPFEFRAPTSQDSHWALLYEMKELLNRGNNLHSSYDLYFWIRHAERTLCTDPRDRVYAILGFLHWKKDVQPIHPDYNISVNELFLQLQRLYMTKACQWDNIVDHLARPLGVSILRRKIYAHVLIQECCAEAFIEQPIKARTTNKLAEKPHWPTKCPTWRAFRPHLKPTGFLWLKRPIPDFIARVPPHDRRRRRILFSDGSISLPCTDEVAAKFEELEKHLPFKTVQIDGSDRLLLVRNRGIPIGDVAFDARSLP